MSLQTPQKVMSANRTEQFAIKKKYVVLGKCRYRRKNNGSNREYSEYTQVDDLQVT